MRVIDKLELDGILVVCELFGDVAGLARGTGFGRRPSGGGVVVGGIARGTE